MSRLRLAASPYTPAYCIQPATILPLLPSCGTPLIYPTTRSPFSLGAPGLSSWHAVQARMHNLTTFCIIPKRCMKTVNGSAGQTKIEKASAFLQTRVTDCRTHPSPSRLVHSHHIPAAACCTSMIDGRRDADVQADPPVAPQHVYVHVPAFTNTVNRRDSSNSMPQPYYTPSLLPFWQTLRGQSKR